MEDEGSEGAILGSRRPVRRPLLSLSIDAEAQTREVAMAWKEDDRVQGSLEGGTAGLGENLDKSQGLGVERGGRETVRADSRLLVLFSDGGDMGRGVGGRDQVGCGVSWFTKVSGACGGLCLVLRREIGLEADLGGIRLATSVVSLTPGSVPATEPKRLPWVTPKGPAAQQEEPLLLLLSRL